MYLWTSLSTLAIMWHTYLIGVSFGLCNFFVKCKNILFLYIGYNVAYHSNCLAILFTTFKKPLSVIRMFWKKWKGVIWKQKHCKFDSYIHLTICLDNELPMRHKNEKKMLLEKEKYSFYGNNIKMIKLYNRHV